MLDRPTSKAVWLLAPLAASIVVGAVLLYLTRSSGIVALGFWGTIAAWIFGLGLVRTIRPAIRDQARSRANRGSNA